MAARHIWMQSYSLKSASFPTTVIFLIISCFFDLTIAEVFSVNLLKKAGGWEALGGDREPTLQEGDEKQTFCHGKVTAVWRWSPHKHCVSVNNSRSRRGQQLPLLCLLGWVRGPSLDFRFWVGPSRRDWFNAIIWNADRRCFWVRRRSAQYTRHYQDLYKRQHRRHRLHSEPCWQLWINTSVF